jgi:DNA repair protein RadC
MYQQKLSIRYWAEDDRPREKMILKGKNALSDAELIAILIGTGSSTKTAVDLGRELLALANGDLHTFSKLRQKDLQTVK